MFLKALQRLNNRFITSVGAQDTELLIHLVNKRSQVINDSTQLVLAVTDANALLATSALSGSHKLVSSSLQNAVFFSVIRLE